VPARHPPERPPAGFLDAPVHEGKLDGLREGELQGLREALMWLLARAGIALSADERACIQTCADPATLDRWIDNVLGGEDCQRSSFLKQLAAEQAAGANGPKAALLRSAALAPRHTGKALDWL